MLLSDVTLIKIYQLAITCMINH